MVYWYFVVFSFVNDHHRAWGNCELPTTKRVEGLVDVRLWQTILEKRYGGDCLVTAFQLLRTEDRNLSEELLVEILVAKTLMEVENEAMSKM